MDERRTYRASTTVSPRKFSLPKNKTFGLNEKLGELKVTEPELEIETRSTPSEILSCGIAPNEKYVALGMKNGEILLIHLDEDLKQVVLMGHYSEVKCVCITNDSSLLVSGSYDGRVYVWNLESKEIISELTGHKEKILAMCVSKDDRIVATADMDKTIWVWDLKKLVAEFRITELRQVGFSLAITSDNSKLVIGCGNNKILIWSLEENRRVGKCLGHEWPITSVCLNSDDTRLISSSMDHTVRVWNMTDYTLIRIIDRKEDTIENVCISHDDKYLVYGGHDGTLSIAEIDNYNNPVLLTHPLHSAKVSCVSISQSGRFILTGSYDKTFKVAKISEFPHEIILEGHDKVVNDIKFTSDSKLMLTASDDFNINVWTTGINSYEYLLLGHEESVLCLAISADDNICVSGSADCTVRVWDIKEEVQITCLKGHQERVHSVFITSDQKLIISGSQDRTVNLWDLDDHILVKTLNGHSGVVRTVCATVDGNWAFTAGNDKNIIKWDLLQYSEKESRLRAHEGAVTSLVMQNTVNRLISCGCDGTIRIWDIDGLISLSVLRSEEENVNTICMNADEDYLVSIGNTKVVRLWSLVNRDNIGVLYDSSKIYTCAFSPNSKWFASGMNNTIILARSCIVESDSKGYWIVPYKYSYLFRYLLYKLLNGNKTTIDQFYMNYTLLPLGFNLLHIICSMNYWRELKQLIKQGSKFNRCSTGETPLTISLDKRHKLCAEIIVKNFPNYIMKTNRNNIDFIVSDLERLNSSSLPSLHLLYGSLLEIVEDQGLPTYGTFLSAPPVIKSHSHPEIHANEFVVPRKDEMKPLEESEIEFRRSLIKMDLSLGSQASIDFFRSLGQCDNREVFRTELIQTILKYKWRQILWIIWVQTVLYLVKLVILTIYCFSDFGNLILIVLLFVMNTLFLIYEVIQFMGEVSSYFKSSMNILDMLRIGTLYMYLFCAMIPLPDESLIVILSIIILLFWVRLVAYIRMFDGTRYLIRMLIEVIKDMGPFFLVFVTSTLGFCISFYVADREDSDSNSSFTDILLHSYSLAYGDFNTSEYSTALEIVIFALASLINTLILLNLLIAIMTATYDRVRKDLDVFDRKEMSEIILEIDSIYLMGRNKGVRKYLQSCGFPKSKGKKGKGEMLKTIGGNLKCLDEKADSMSKTIETLNQQLAFLAEKSEERVVQHLISMVQNIKNDMEGFKDEVLSSINRPTNKI